MGVHESADAAGAMPGGGAAPFAELAAAANGARQTTRRGPGHIGDAVRRFRTQLLGYQTCPSADPFRFTGTAFEMLVIDFKLWSLMSWMCLWIALRYGGAVDAQSIPDIFIKYLGYMTAVLSFMLVFFLNSTYSEFKEQVRAAVIASGPIKIGLMSRVLFKHEPVLQQRLVRLINAAYYMSWMDVAGFYSYTELFERGLVSKAELAALQASPLGKKFRVPIVWALDMVVAFTEQQLHLQDAWEQLPLDTRGERPPTVNELTLQRTLDYIYDANSAFNSVSIIRSANIPVIYVHMLWWFMMVILTLLGTFAGLGVDSNAANPDLSGAWFIFGYMLVVLGFLSVFNVAMALKEPFGEDSTDVDPLNLVEGTIKAHVGMLAVPNLAEAEHTVPAYDSFSELRRGGDSGGYSGYTGDAPAPARGPLHAVRSSKKVSKDLHRVLYSRLPQDSKDLN